MLSSLPTALSSKQLDSLLASFPPSAEIRRGDGVVTVHATRKSDGQRTKLLSAISRNGRTWHVMTVPGLVSSH